MPALLLPDSLKARLDESELAALTRWEGAATSRERVERLHGQLDRLFDEGFDVAELVVARAAIADRVLTGLWRHHGLERAGAALVAVGGYGRGELHPGSDIDLLLLFDAEPDQAFGEAISAFLTTLWDIRYQVGHSVRTLDECVREATDDITVATNLMEARALAGDSDLFAEMMRRTAPPAVWPSADFFRAKLAEQEERHRRFGDTAYRLEPNIKESPGGLRDIQMIGWVTKRHFGARSLEELLHRGFLERDEYEALMAGEHYLWRLRYALHRLSGRKEDRLLFDYQKTLALQFGHEDGPGNLAVEAFMQHYYRTITELGRLNEMLLQLYDEEILHADETAEVVPVNARFQVRNGYLEIRDEEVFDRTPSALLELFLILQEQPEIRGVRAGTIRSVRRHLHLIDDAYRDDIRNKSLFMEILRQPRGVTHQFRRMNRYGVLAAYLPEFGNIVGRMQYDLFHAYTVDEHTMMVLRNARRVSVPEFRHELPLASQVFEQLPKPELLYIACLFHDIAKGRGGDHSVLGAQDAERFCRRHGLSDWDTALVAWLVRNHLLMSMTAQQKDISDPDVVHEFARRMGNTTRLDYLYLLTVSDIRGTNPELWNSWKDSLLATLYRQSKQVLRRGLDNPADHAELVQEVRGMALRQLEKAGVETERVESLWRQFEDDYFLRYSADDIAWHARLILSAADPEALIVTLRHNADRDTSELFVYYRDLPDLFARITRALDQQNLNILDARILGTRSGMAIDTLQLHGPDGHAVTDPARIEAIEQRVRQAIEEEELPVCRIGGPRSRQHRHFEVPARIHFSHDPRRNMTLMELVAEDRPGLLSQVAEVLRCSGVRLHLARIATVGEQADDMLYLTDELDQPLDETTREQLRRALLAQIGEAA